MSQKPVKPLPDEILAALQGGKWMDAIRLLRAQVPAQQGQSREMADAQRVAAGRHHPPLDLSQPPLYREGLSPGEVPRSEDSWRTLVIVVIAVVLAYLYFTR